MEKLEGKVALVTGGGRGIGKAIALLFAKEGAKVIVNDISSDSAEKVAQEIKSSGKSALPFRADVSNYDEDKKMVQTAISEFGDIHILVNNAGIPSGFPAEEITLSQWNRMLGVCLSGPFYLCQLVGKQMITARSGKIVNMSSMAGLFGPILMADYSAAKHGVVGLTKALGVEWAKYNINVNCICPGITETEMAREWGSKYPDVMAKRLARVPLKRLAQPEDMASVALFLASSDSDYMTGSVLSVDGGNGALFSGFSLE
jgi:NAD(P)-dependent dehydrogenase (short-subunit alcohol dehydrogenase family)